MTKEEFISVVQTHQKSFRSFLVALCCGDAQLADDIAQESFIKAFLYIGSLRKPSLFKSWLYRIGYNSFLNHRRSKNANFESLESMEAVAEDTADSGFKYQELYAALDKLSYAERTSILLHYMENYSIMEIAEIENISSASVKQHLSRGRWHLQKLLDDR